MSEELDILRAVVAPNSDQLNADDLTAGEITVRIVSVAMTKGTGKKGEQKTTITLDGGWKPWRPCKSMVRLMVGVWGEKWRTDWAGHTVVLFNDRAVTFGDKDNPVGGIRVRAMTGITQPTSVMLTTTRGAKKPYVVQPFVAAKPVREFDRWAVDVRGELGLDPAAVAEWYAASGKGDLTAAGRDVLGPLYAGLNGGADLAAFRASPFGAS